MMAGPVEHGAPMVAATGAYLADLRASIERANSVPRETQLARVDALREVLRGAVSIEAVRAGSWARLPLAVRRVAVMSANIDKARASDALATFSAFERGSIWVAVEKLRGALSDVMLCAQGGRV